MITGTLDECRRAAEAEIVSRAEAEGYEVLGASEATDGTLCVVSWLSPKGRELLEYRYTPNEDPDEDEKVAPLAVRVMA